MSESTITTEGIGEYQEKFIKASADVDILTRRLGESVKYHSETFRQLRDARTTVRDTLSTWVFSDETVLLEDANALLEKIGAEVLTPKWTVVATLQGNTLGKWTVEAESAEEAEYVVSGSLSLTCDTDELDVEVDTVEEAEKFDTYEVSVSVDLSDLLADLASDIEYTVTQG